MRYLFALFFFINVHTVCFASENYHMPLHEQNPTIILNRILCVEASVSRIEELLRDLDYYADSPERTKAIAMEIRELLDNINHALHH